MRGASHRRGETQKERLSREMDVSLRTAISLHSRKFDHSEETSFPLFLSFAIRKGVVNDDAEILVIDGFEVNFIWGEELLVG